MLRNPNTIPKEDIIIEDPAMEPFFISKAKSGAGGFTVFERVIKGENNTHYIRTVCYPSTFNGALRTVAKELLNSGEKIKYTSVKEYMQKWDSITTRMEHIVAID
jgi:hypothetical protein